MVAPPSAVTVPWPLLPQPGHIHSQHTAHLAAHMSPGTPGKVMEASGSSSQSQDSGGVHRETEDHCADHGELEVLKDELQLCGGAAGEMVPTGESGLRRRGSGSAEGEVEASQLRRLNIKKDDEFFHFVLLCFAIGALLVCYHYYADWFMSLGVGLLTFASLETIGIYFGLVYRIHSVLQGFIPLLQKFRLPGFRRTN
ncbi:transmembrane protein 40 isoform X4 [Mus musculus]|uniref:transmembrane protein 40 isoform X4 n=2 Tax=Mus musculus TaxID=10090 RepID=UPI0003D6E946|nr:transmembrane protein 40 isoform X4 [Mus musculus]|eukprot:XP_011239815.1 PREDICTED: transmembrane protein 40 isoform X5 [Mus musculus]